MSAHEEHEVGVVRCTTNRVFGIYDKVKNFSPILRYGFETVENHIPSAVVNIRDPLIDGLDNRIDNLRGKAVPIQEKFQTLDADHDGKVSVADVKTSVAAGATEAVTRTTVKLKDLRGDLSKKAAERIEKGLGQVREFSATRGKEIVHVDLIQYAREVIDGASSTVSSKFHVLTDAVSPIYEPVHQKVVAGVRKTGEVLHGVQETVVHLSTEKLEQVRAAREGLRRKLRAAIEGARDLVFSSFSYVQTKYGAVKDNVYRLPREIVSRLPTPAQKSIHFILSSPQLYGRVKERAELDRSKRTIENINNLVSAVKSVVLEGVSEGEGHEKDE